MSDSIVIALVLIGFFVIAVGMFGLVIYIGIQKRKQNEQMSARLGFSPVADPQPLTELFAYLYQRPLEQARLPLLAHRQGNGYETYLFDLYEQNTIYPTQRASLVNLEKTAFAFVSPAWNFPRVVSALYFDGEGKLAKLANQAAEKMADAHSARVQFPHIPQLDKRYHFSVFDADPAQVSLPDDFLRILAASPDLSLHFGRTMFTIAYAGMAGAVPTEEQARELYRIGIRLADTFPAK